MENIQSWSHRLHDYTSFCQVQEEDPLTTYIWKIPAGRISSSFTLVASLTETVFFAALAFLASPLYLIDSEGFSVITAHTSDAAFTAAHATKRFFGLEKVKEETAAPSPEVKPPLSPKPSSLWGKSIQFLKNRVSDATQIALKHPNTTLVIVLGAVTLATAYYFGAFDSVFKQPLPLKPVPKGPFPTFPNGTYSNGTYPQPNISVNDASSTLKNMCFRRDFNPFLKRKMCTLLEAPPPEKEPLDPGKLWKLLYQDIKELPPDHEATYNFPAFGHDCVVKAEKMINSVRTMTSICLRPLENSNLYTGSKRITSLEENGKILFDSSEKIFTKKI